MPNPEKAKIADVALHGAVAAIKAEFPARVTNVQWDALQAMVRIAPVDGQGGPRYYLIKVSEPQ